MSSERKFLKIISFVCFVAAIVCAVFGVIELVDCASDFDVTSLLAGLLAIVAAVAGVLQTVYGIQGANTPRKAGKAKTWGWITLVVAAVDTVLGFVASSWGVAILALILAVCGLLGGIYAGKVIKQADR